MALPPIDPNISGRLTPQSAAAVPQLPSSPRVPFFSRLGVKHGIVLTTLVLLAMTIVTAQQLRETLWEIERSAVDKGRAVATAMVPAVLYAMQRNKPSDLQGYFNYMAKSRDIDYVQIINESGHVEISSEIQDAVQPAPLAPNWITSMPDKQMLTRYAIAQPWPADFKSKGVDVFVALLEDPAAATIEQVQNADHLRIGINFDAVVRKDTPRVIWNMVMFTLVVAFIMVLGLLILLGYILRPLRELHAGLRAVASGDLNYEVPVYSRDEVGRVVQAFNATTARLRAAFEQIESLATTDALTGLPNRRVFDERLASEAARARRYRHPFGLIVMDLDKFKDINDRYGHPAGDEVLKFVSKTIQANIRETDVPARIGGEEFAVILPETGPVEVRAVAEKLRSAVAEFPLKPSERLPENVRITLSGGAACSAGHLVTAESMMAAADAALYRSKSEGRNRINMAAKVVGQSDMMRRVEDAEKGLFQDDSHSDPIGSADKQ